MFLARVRKRLSYTNVLLVLALVLAMSGGAVAAGVIKITSIKQISPKVLAQLKKEAKGANGANGANGAVGPVGPVGPAGPSGGKGEKGERGERGEAGPEGKKGATGPEGPEGERGPTGAKGPTGGTGPGGAAGSTGNTGPEGVCSTAKCTLPSKVTETGAWSANVFGIPSGIEIPVAISFPIPLPASSKDAFFCNNAEVLAGQGECFSSLHGKVEKATGCVGTVAEPSAPAGKLCVYGGLEENTGASLFEVRELGENGEFDGKTGAVIVFKTSVASAVIRVAGTFAVTAE